MIDLLRVVYRVVSRPLLRLLPSIFCISALLQSTSPDEAKAAERGRPSLPAQFVYLRDVDPTILQDIKYATTRNFTGAQVPGYKVDECVLTTGVAEALKKVQAELVARALSLKVYDCYRPKRAVKAFMEWVKNSAGMNATNKRFYPNITKKELIDRGYISAASGHSRGDTVDLTLVQLPLSSERKSEAARHAACTESAQKREFDNSVDMGTSFDCFDPKSNTSNASVAAEQLRWRNVLVEAMKSKGFRNYQREWWHFTFGDGTGPSYDFPIDLRTLEQSR